MLTPYPSVDPSAQLRIDVSRPSPNAARVTVTGEIDLSTADMLRAGLLDVMSAPYPDRIEIDLAGLTFMDCGGITNLVVAGDHALRNGCQLRVTNPRPIVRRLLQLTGMLDALTAGFDQTSPAAASADVPASRGIGLVA